MAKRTPSYLSAEKVLSPKEYEELKEYRKRIKKRSLRVELERLKKQSDQKRKLAKYKTSVSGKIGTGIRSSFSAIAGGSKGLYGKKTTSKGKSNGRGRPKGTVKYRDPQTGQPIGVYEYRKILRARLAIAKARAKRQAEISPREQAVLQRVNYQQRINQMSPERRTIPDTYGNVQLNNIFKQIEDASNLVK